ncbi:MAG: biopolymer transporter ExbD [Jaaginema sp. PMC 1079.18]|nr:biopolymer transporter ExbD [Jaaginema sp. PMC 1080.18]MEC4852385.1 biopolymer transporter ExbD [Jaaginema sp. PMC 1079.18]MEC4869098.1 biopolymer transporter ExbD [Jaaginema sp. PMC 1078.18]
MTAARDRQKQATNSSSTSRPLRLWFDGTSNQEVRIEIIPLIDVIFCILTFFILAAVGFSRQQAISLDLPKASSGAPQMQEMLIISLDYAGQVYVEQQPVRDAQLYAAVESYFLNRPDGLMVLYASKDVTYDRVIQVLDILREVGGDRVALATLPESPNQPPTDLPNTPDFGTGFPDAVPGLPGDDSLDSFDAPPVPESPVTPDSSASPTEPDTPASPVTPAPAPEAETEAPSLPDAPTTEN